MDKDAEIAQLKLALRRLTEAVQAFGEARYFEDDEEMDESGKDIDAAMKYARTFL